MLSLKKAKNNIDNKQKYEYNPTCQLKIEGCEGN